MTWTNVGLIVAALVSLATAGVALWRASAQRGVDEATIERMQDEHDARRTARLYLLELYLDRDVDYHRDNREYIAGLKAVIRAAQAAGFIPEDPDHLPPHLRMFILSEPPKAPDLPPPAISKDKDH